VRDILSEYKKLLNMGIDIIETDIPIPLGTAIYEKGI
jgi:hypothetical protein